MQRLNLLHLLFELTQNPTLLLKPTQIQSIIEFLKVSFK